MVTYETKVWEKDWRFILKGNYLKKVIERCDYPFAKRVIMINNVNDRTEVEHHARKRVQEGIIDAFYFVGDYEQEVLQHFGLTKDSFKGGYYYSIAELTSIYLCETEYLLHFSGDSFMAHKKNWIKPAIEIMEARPDIFTANPVWNHAFALAQKEAVEELSAFYIGRGFSDQCYLLRAREAKKNIYMEQNAHSDAVYPEYGGELFEKRVDAYMRNHNLYRLTSKEASYIHENFPYQKTIYTNTALLRLIFTKRRLR